MALTTTGAGSAGSAAAACWTSSRVAVCSPCLRLSARKAAATDRVSVASGQGSPARANAARLAPPTARANTSSYAPLPASPAGSLSGGSAVLRTESCHSTWRRLSSSLSRPLWPWASYTRRFTGSDTTAYAACRSRNVDAQAGLAHLSGWKRRARARWAVCSSSKDALLGNPSTAYGSRRLSSCAVVKSAQKSDRLKINGRIRHSWSPAPAPPHARRRVAFAH